jgi:hypothetical protein
VTPGPTIFGGVDDDHHADDETSQFYREGVTGGKALLSVDTDDGEGVEVADLLRATGAEQVHVFGDEGWFE